MTHAQWQHLKITRFGIWPSLFFRPFSLTNNIIITGIEPFQFGYPKYSIWQGDVGVVGNIQSLQRPQIGDLVRQFRHLIMG